MLKLVSLAAFGLAFEGEEDGWTDNFGWSCRDYGRVPEQCDSSMGKSAGASSSCFVCFERRRRTSCSDCISNFEQCRTTQMSICDSQFNSCERTCENAVVPIPNPAPSPFPTDPPTGGTNSWLIPAIIGTIALCLLCLLAGLLYMCCRPAEMGDCSQAADAQPMIIQAVGSPAAAPCDTGECDTGCEQPMQYAEPAGSCGQNQYYSPQVTGRAQAYPQQGPVGYDYRQPCNVD